MARFGLDAETPPRAATRSSSSCRRRRTAPPDRTRWRRAWRASSARPVDCPSRPGTPTAHRPRSASRRTTGAGAALAVAVLAALLHRARTGEGQHVDLASREVVVASSPDALLAEQLGVPWPIRVGNGHREFAPHDVYRAAGEDDWVAVAVGDESEWAALCSVLGRDDWVRTAIRPRRPAGSRAPRSTTRSRHGPGQRSSREAFEALQAAGVPAMAVMTNESLATDPHLAARDVFVDIEHPELGRTRVMRQPWLFSDLDIDLRHGPLMGQDNDYVLDTILGLSTERARRTRGRAAMTTPGGDLQIGVVGGGDARQVRGARSPAHRLAVDRWSHRVAQPEPRGHGRPRAPRHPHRAGPGGDVDPPAAALPARTRRQADRRSRPRHQRPGDARRRHRR